MGDANKEGIRQALCFPTAGFLATNGTISNGTTTGVNFEGLFNATNVTTAAASLSNSTTWTPTETWTTPGGGGGQNVDFRLQLQIILYQKVVVGICCLGLLGNLLNLVVLTQKSLLYTLGRMEKFVYTGLISLALSDMLVCGAVIPHGFVGELAISEEKTFALFYHAYSNGVINTFVMCSTWLTVTMAVGRYFVTCHPFRAREMIGMTFAMRTMAVVLSLCVLFNLPRFWISAIDDVTCPDGRAFYFVTNGYIKVRLAVYRAYMWLYFCLCILVPLIVLTYCNVGLVRALRLSVITRKEIRQSSAHVDGSNRITLTLIIIVLMNILLVCPAEIIAFLRDMALSSSKDAVAYDLAVACVNTLQALNFSLNFILYCVINAHFRRTMGDLLRCRCLGKKSNHVGGQSTNYTLQSTISNSTYHPIATHCQAGDKKTSLC